MLRANCGAEEILVVSGLMVMVVFSW